ncbi:Calcineurin-like phosphoesterase [Faunimonas pinastri]|uniref:Calcineurin-like phosphoesterase n=1 Tax=Faunimonas pinastri TaxID=1855383 RepID=A0A1H9MYI8_9HYPH|nr:metallophosphoesterase [Faunimonas pinastri]SER28475.1 Calcineurin-like phosphoesterase [Faunimonas pinastri]
MDQPYGLMSDQHCHDWSAFSTVDADGVNSRLRIILNEMERAAAEVKAAGGNLLVFGGDLFHQRGSLNPEVFNPTHQCLKRILASGVEIVAIPGNHDNKSKDTTELGNAIQTIGALPNFGVATKTTLLQDVSIALVPWRASLDQLRVDLAELRDSVSDADELDVVIHAGIDGVLTGVPEHGLTADELAKYGFKRIFAGHYHNHKVMAGGKVTSIGAATHQTWSDVGTKAGFLIVHPDRIDYRASHAPNFVDITGDTDPDDIPLIVDGNYARVRGMKLADSEVKELREELQTLGARGVSIQVAREVVSARAASSAPSAISLEASVAKYVDDLGADEAAIIKSQCADILAEVQSITV